jgi:formyltetrahydrofolate synthetase
VRPVVCINKFSTDTEAEIDLICKTAQNNGAFAAVGQQWLKGGEGARELAEAVIQACNEKNNFKFLYELDTPLRQRIELIAKEVYGASGVEYTPIAVEKAKTFEADPASKTLGTCMVKTHLSLSHNPDIKGRPRDWLLPIRDIMTYKGAGFIVPVAGDIKLMPGTGSNPAFRRIDVDVNSGKVQGLF